MVSNYKEMTVDQLKQESRERGLKLQENGKKFNKGQLIERLLEDDALKAEEAGAVGENECWDDFSSSEEGLGIMPKDVQESAKALAQAGDDGSTGNLTRKHKTMFAVTLEEIKQKYSFRRKRYVYDRVLDIGSMVVFVVGYDGVEKLRTGKVYEIDREKESVMVETFMGDLWELGYDELLYITEAKKKWYPEDIHKFLERQRTDRGRELIYEKIGYKYEQGDNGVRVQAVRSTAEV